ncbi:MAG: thioredoxin fold domain-containing protein [Armatimonadia bacterium]|nr:thioredoxin fold domain-containing protein [Armatimonadia bacterium]
MAMRRKWMTVLAVFGASLVACSAMADGALWHGSMKAALTAAGESGRPVLVEFYSAGCGPCAQMEQVTLADEAVSAVIAERFEAVRVSALKQPDLATKYLVSFYPTVKFVDANGASVYDCQGFVPPEDFLSAMNKASAAHAALKRAQKVAANGSEDPAVMLAAARDFRTAQQYAEAAEWAERAAVGAGADAIVAEARFVLGAALTDAGEPGRAQQPLIDALKQADEAAWQWEARLKLGYVWLQRGEEDSGIGLLQTVHASEQAAAEVRGEATRLLRWWGVDVD